MVDLSLWFVEGSKILIRNIVNLLEVTGKGLLLRPLSPKPNMKQVLVFAALAAFVVACGPSQAEIEAKAKHEADSVAAVVRAAEEAAAAEVAAAEAAAAAAAQATADSLAAAAAAEAAKPAKGKK